jgi:hypothetical protein
VAESQSAVPALRGLAIEAVEWLPSGADSGLVRVRGRWTEADAREPDLPVLALRAAGGEHRFDSLPDARFSRDPDSWRGTYLVPAALVAPDPDALWLEWPSGARAGLPPLARGVEPAFAAPERPELPEPRGQVIDRAVLAERRARRAEAAEEAQTRVANEALKAVEVLELRSAELERRLEEATAARDELVTREAGAAGRREALAAALASAAELRTRAREWQLRLRTSEVARSSDAVRLAVIEAERATGGSAMRSALHERGVELEALRREAAERAGELAAASEAAAAVRADLARERDAFADARSAWDRHRGELEAALRDVRAELEAAREEARLRAQAEADLAATTAELDRTRDEAAASQAELESLQTRLEHERRASDEARTELERTLAEVRAEGDELRGRVDRLAAALAAAEARVQTAETLLAAAESRVRVETVARSTLEDELDRERDTNQATRAALESDLAAAQAALEAERANAEAAVEAERANSKAGLEAERTNSQAALEEARSEIAGLREAAGDLEAERATVADARSEIERLRQAAGDLEAERAARAAAEEALATARAEAERTGASLQERIADLERQASRAEDLVRRAREQSEAAAAAPRAPSDEAGRIVADLDAAAEALRRRPPAPPAEPDAPPKPAGPRIVSPSRQPARGLVMGTKGRKYPPLRGAIVKLAHDDPETAGRLLVALLPAQGVALAEPVAYDLTIRELGTFAVTVAGKRAFVERLEQPRPRAQADFHLSGDALSLAELLAGVDHRIRRFAGPLRVRGKRKRLDLLRALTKAELSLADLAQAGAKLDPELVYRTFAYAVHPSWTRGHGFTIAQEIVGDPPETWYLTARDGAGLAVAASPPATPDATVSMTRGAFDRLVRGEPVPPGERPAVRGDREAVDLMRAWTQRARGA